MGLLQGLILSLLKLKWGWRYRGWGAHGGHGARPGLEGAAQCSRDMGGDNSVETSGGVVWAWGNGWGWRGEEGAQTAGGGTGINLSAAPERWVVEKSAQP